MKVKKVILRKYDAANREWVAFYPRTDGSSVFGTVPDARTVGGQYPSEFMPSTFPGGTMAVVVDDGGKPAAVTAARLTLSTRPNDQYKINDGDLYVLRNVYLQNGRVAATITDLEEASSLLRSTFKFIRVNNAVEAERLETPVLIDDQVFDGTQNIKPVVYVVSTSAPADTTKLWVHKTEHVMRYHDGAAWRPVVGAWFE